MFLFNMFNYSFYFITFFHVFYLFLVARILFNSFFILFFSYITHDSLLLPMSFPSPFICSRDNYSALISQVMVASKQRTINLSNNFFLKASIISFNICLCCNHLLRSINHVYFENNIFLHSREYLQKYSDSSWRLHTIWKRVSSVD